MQRLALFTALAALAATAPAARALLVLEGGKSQVFVTAAGTVAWDSNVYSNADAEDDVYETARLALDYERTAGVLSANLGAEWVYSHFERLDGESSVQPSLRGSLARKRGRLTGKAAFGWRRANESDNFANRRTRFRETTGELELRYPVNHRFSLKTEVSHEDRDYRDPTLFDHKLASASVDVFHAYTSKLDLVGSYRTRWTDVRGAPDRVDHALLVGATGKLLPRMDGSLRVGFQRRLVDGAGGGALDAFTAAMAAMWAPRNWLNLTFQVSKDFATTSTGLSTDGVNVSLESRLAAVGQLAATAGVGYARYSFYDGVARTRSDDSVHVRLGAEYPLTKRLKCTASATWLRNSSTFAFADYDRRLLSLGVSARY